jgi:hypothetical protein
MTLHQSLTMVLYGQSKVGKSTLAATAPGPRVLLDVEGGARFLPIKPVAWDPVTQAPPEDTGTWDTAVVSLTEFATLQKAYEWLKSGNHPFKSVIIDSVTEAQVKIVDSVAGRNQVKMQDWGEILRSTTGLMRDMRDLTMHPTNPLTSVVLIAMETEGQDGKKRPWLQGKSGVTLPYLFDITGHLRVEEYPNPDPTQANIRVRRLVIGPNDEALAGERVGGRLGEVVEEGDLNISTMIDRVYGSVPAETA